MIVFVNIKNNLFLVNEVNILQALNIDCLFDRLCKVTSELDAIARLSIHFNCD